MQWEQIKISLEPFETKFNQSYKCINQNRAIKSETLNKHVEILIENFNSIRAILHRQYDRYSNPHRKEADETFLKLRDRLLKIFHKHEIKIKVPLSLSCEVNVKIIDTDDSDHEETQINIMTRTEDDILDKTTKIVPVFDGNINELQSFLDALGVIDRIKETHEMVAIEVIKTKLRGQARNLITNETTIQAVCAKLKSSIQGESSDLLCSKLMNIKQNSKSATSYAEEIQEITKKLSGAYIREGYPHDIAEKLIRQNAAKAISRNASNDEVKLIIKTGNFTSLNDVVSKFVEASTEAASPKASVFYFNRRENNTNRGNGRFSNYRGRGHGRRHNNYNNSNNNYNNNNNGQRRGRNNAHRGEANNARNRGSVRLVQEAQENGTTPQNEGGNVYN